jgi:hypothetical protein
MSPPQNLDEVRRLEGLAFRGWPALECLDVAGWHLRLSGGYTKRANSINALGSYLSTSIAALEAPYQQRSLPPVWRLTPLAPPAIAGLLEARGYRAIDRSHLQVCSLHDSFAADPAVAILPASTPDWIAAFAAHSPVRPEHREPM